METGTIHMATQSVTWTRTEAPRLPWEKEWKDPVYEVRPDYYKNGRWGVYDTANETWPFWRFGELAVQMSRRSAQIVMNTLNQEI